MAQYQHYIPQFLLRNFSHPFIPPKGKRSTKRGKSHAKKGMHRGDKVLNVVDLASDKPQLLESPVSRWFGQENMYDVVADTIKGRKDVEDKLSKLESRTAVILQKSKTAFEKGEPGIWLTRVEKNHLRKFLFIMKYRGPDFYEKYQSEDPQMYTSEDKLLVWTYMVENGMTRPKDVWLHNIRTILDLDMDVEERWISKLPELMFPADAQMFVFHAHVSYMAFCTPSENDNEFILTDQCYNVFEGPTHETFCARTGEYFGNTYLCYHEFGPITPRLIIVLRSSILPEPLEDMNPEIRKSRQRMFEAVATQFPDPQKIKSILFDLPVAKATNSYTRVVNGRIEAADDAAGKRQASDKFYFRFWPLSTKHVDTINFVFLDNLLRCNSIVFRSLTTFQRTLEAYMTTSDSFFKTVGLGEHGARVCRLDCLEKLSAVLKILGSTAVPIWSDKHEAGTESFVQCFDDVWLKMMKKVHEDCDEPLSRSEATPFWKAYYTLGVQAVEILQITANHRPSRRVPGDIPAGLGPVLETSQARSSGIYVDHEYR